MTDRKSALLGALSALLLPAMLAAQEARPTGLVQQAGGLKVVVVQGEGALNSVKTKTATQPVVEVRDDTDKPVAGAEVVFQLPAAGPGGVFNGWMRTQTTRSDAQGRASASGMTPNDEEGRFNIKVTATAGARSASTVIGQSNGRMAGGAGGGGAKVSKGNRNLLILAALAGVGAIAGGVAATRGNGSSSASAATVPVTITPGPVTVGAPR